MNIRWSEKVDEILSAGKWDEYHHNWLLTKEQTLVAMDKLRKAGIGVLGGDVSEIREGRFEYNYDNWHCDPEEGESDADFALRSYIAAKNYINAYPVIVPEKPIDFFFEIVPETKKRFQQIQK